MRKVKYGRFVDFMPLGYDDNGLIGGHIYASHSEEESLKTAGYEYYIIDNNVKKTIDDGTMIEKMRARFMFLFEPKKKKVLGTRSKSIVNPYINPNPQLGVKLDENGDKVIDKSYYESHEKRIINDPKKSDKTKLEELKIIREQIQKMKTNLEEEKISSHSRR